ncbi:MAG: tyrosine-type recombinase/integrase [Oscillospiraceae bacterium]|nr:tyrosine-type recombinase/integrase [Oscillospiraceae bacterium]
MKLPNGYGTVKKMSGKRRRPYVVKKTVGWRYDEVKDKMIQEQMTIGYAATRAEGLQMLAEYNNNPFDLKAAKVTFQEVYERWSKEKYPTISQSNVKGYEASYKVCGALYDKVFKELRLADLQFVVDTSGKNYPTLRKLKNLLSQMYDYAMKHDICNKDYSEFVDIVKYKDKNPDKRDRNKFAKEEINRLWELAENPYYQIVLMLIYNGCRISEFLDLKKEDVHLDEQYFDVIASKTENGLRKVPIADKVLPFYKAWFEGSQCEYLLHTPEQKHFDYRNYYDSYFTPLMEQLGFEHTPHDTRHSCISMLTEAHVDQTMIKKIVGHAGAMTLTERVYTHLDIETLVEAINKI